MPKEKYIIELKNKERIELTKIIKTGSSPVKVITRANVLLVSDASTGKPLTVAETAECFNTTPTTVQTIKTAFVEFGLDGAFYRKKHKTPPIQES